jgi:hypothetical protein
MLNDRWMNIITAVVLFKLAVFGSLTSGFGS